MSMQLDWRFCQKCRVLYFDGYPDKGSCAAGGGHNAAGYNFVLPHDLPSTPTGQDTWRNCEKCQALYFDGYPDKGSCAAGGGHNAAGYNFVLPHDLPSTLDFDHTIVLDGGVPVGGSTHLTVRQDGSYTFSGHLHDSGATEYNVSAVWVVKDSQNIAYTFQHSGHVYGTFEPGSRDDDWAVDSRDDRLANNWVNLGVSAMGIPGAHAAMDVINLTNSLIGLAGTVLGVVAIAAA